MKKIILGLISACLSICTFTFAGCGETGIEDFLKEVRSAESFSVSTGNNTILQCDGGTLYWKYVYGVRYSEYYFSPDNEGKYWMYGRDYSADKWLKEAIPASEYYNYIYTIKSGFGITNSNFFTLIDCICLDFPACTIEDEGKYSLIEGFRYDITFWESDGSFIFEYDGGDEPIKYTVSAINKTKIELPASLTEAEVGIVNLP